MSNDTKKRKFDDRPIDFIEEIKIHLLIWKNSAFYKNVNLYVKESFEQLLEAIDISMTTQKIGVSGDANSKSINARRMIKMYKDKYLELTDLNCEEDIAGATFIIISRFVEKLEKDGSSIQEFVSWFFDDFLRQPENKKFIPPSIKLMMSNFITQKYFYEHKDLFKMRKKDAVENKRKLELMKIASELFDLTNDEQLGQMLVSFGNNKTTYLKLENTVIMVAEKSENKDIINKISELRNKNLKPIEEKQDDN